MEHARVALALSVLYLAITASFAQDAGKPPQSAEQGASMLPGSFKGELIGLNNNYAQVSNVIELRIASQDAGKVTGSYTRWIRHRDPSGRCLAADDLPAEGTYAAKGSS